MMFFLPPRVHVPLLRSDTVAFYGTAFNIGVFVGLFLSQL